MTAIDLINTKLEALNKQHQQLTADRNAVGGAIQVCEQLKGDLQRMDTAATQAIVPAPGA